MPYSDPFTALAYGPDLFPEENKRAQTIGAYNNTLTPQDIALSPGRLKDFPLKSWVQATDAKGNVLGQYRVGDTSWFDKNKPTTNTVEFRDRDMSGKQVYLSPLGPGQVPEPAQMQAQATAAASPTPNLVQQVLSNYPSTGSGPAAPAAPAANNVAEFLKRYYQFYPGYKAYG